MKISYEAEPKRRLFTIRHDSNEKNTIESVVELIIIPDIFGKRPAGYIHKVYTDTDFSGRGHASGLVNKAIKTAFEQYDCYKVFLISDEKTAPFYEKLGMCRHQFGMQIRS